MDTKSKVCVYLVCFFCLCGLEFFLFLSLCSARQIQNIADELDEVITIYVIDRKRCV